MAYRLRTSDITKFSPAAQALIHATLQPSTAPITQPVTPSPATPAVVRQPRQNTPPARPSTPWDDVKRNLGLPTLPKERGALKALALALFITAVELFAATAALTLLRRAGGGQRRRR